MSEAGPGPITTEGSTSRRGFLRYLATQAARATYEMLPVDVLPHSESQVAYPQAPTSAPAVAVTPPVRALSMNELRELAGKAGLEHRLDDVRRLARMSFRLTPVPAGSVLPREQHWIWGVSELPLGARWSSARQHALTAVAQIDLTHLYASAMHTALPNSGSMLLFFDQLPISATGPGLVDCEFGSVLLLSEPRHTPAPSSATQMPIGRLSPELSFHEPGRRAFKLGLTEDECGAWRSCVVNLRLARALSSRPVGRHLLYMIPRISG